MIRPMKNKNLLRIIVALFLILIIACGILFIIYLNKQNAVNDKTAPTSMTIVSTKGVDSLVIASVADDRSIDLNYAIVDKDQIKNEFMSANKDMIIAPINLGMTAINEGAPYQLLAITSRADTKIISNNTAYNAKIAYYDEEGINDLVFDSLLDNIPEIRTIVECASYEAVIDAFVNKEVAMAILPEPYLTAAISRYESEYDKKPSTIYELRNLYSGAVGENDYPTGAIFVKKSTMTDRTNEVIEIVNTMRTNMATWKSNPTTIETKAEKLSFDLFGFNDTKILSDGINNMNNEIIYASNCRDQIIALLNYLQIPYKDSDIVS